MKLYFNAGASSTVPHIVLEELGLPFTLIHVDLRSKTYEGGDFRKINPKGQVPVLELESGEILTENVVILQYLVSLKPEVGLLATSGLERFRQLEQLNFLTTEVHKLFSALFTPAMPAKANQIFKGLLKTKFGYINEQLSTREFFSGNAFGLDDAYLFVMTSWAIGMGLDIGSYDKLLSHYEKLLGRASVAKVRSVEIEYKRNFC